MVDQTINYFPEFNDDCYAECEEHFTVIRRDLLVLEKYIDQDIIEKPLLDELFRSFHTLKGLTGMIGQRDAEMLSHILENFLRNLTKNKATLSEPVLDGFFEGVKMLEKLIDSLKNNKKTPDLQPTIERLGKLGNEQDGNNSTSKTTEKEDSENDFQEAEIPLSNSQNIKSNFYRIIFTPSPELFEKGININTIRAKIEAMGEIQQSLPIIPEAGKVAFEFLVLSELELTDVENLFEGTAEISQEKKEEEEIVPAPPSKIFSSDHTFSLANVVRVDLNHLDELVKLIGDLVISRARLDDQLKSLEKEIPVQKYRQIQETAISFERQLRALREGVMRVRLIPIGEIFERMQFVIRDMIKESQKQIVLKISGKDTEIDKVVVEKMLDPLLHLVRNAVSHGIEIPSERIKINKPAEGFITLNAYTSGGSVVIELEDDGNGINKNYVLRKAVELGLIMPMEKLTDAELLDILCLQGFSTREEADMNSGRGVGMAVVKKAIQELGGYFELETEEGIGTKFSIYLPLTLVILDALILTAGGQKYAVPLPMVLEVLMIDHESITIMENNELITYRNNVLPIIRLADYFNLGTSDSCKSQVLVVGSGHKAVGIMVDKVLSLKEIVVRTLNDPFVQVAGITGATELGDGKALLILDTPSLIKAVALKKNNRNIMGDKKLHIIN